MRAVAVVGLALMLGACSTARSGSGAKCPKPIVYDAKTLDQIQKALEKLPPDSVLHDVMRDYENERDDLRFCR
jgi:hypothetical protein